MHENLKKVLDNSARIVFLGGAGISTESGIPDFRSETGLYASMSKYGIPPEEILSHSFFMAKPNIFYQYYKENLIHPDAKPNAAHFALARLEAQGKLTAIVTQNVDGLHQMAGSKNVIQVHGTANRHYCIGCDTDYDLDYVLNPKVRAEHVPLCETCNGIIRPDVVFFGESLDPQAIYAATDAIANADTLIVGGTSLVVYPVAGFVNYFKGDNLIVINKSKTASDSKAQIVIHDSIGAVLGSVVD
ncbi:MAG: NAD-dependent protein deacylase [Clostridiales bacterium]|nr:NAD-dependent protein deacylase [Clostridiales bacterium]